MARLRYSICNQALYNDNSIVDIDLEQYRDFYMFFPSVRPEVCKNILALVFNTKKKDLLYFIRK